MSNDSPILVTGAGGFIALHTIAHLLANGYRVRGTLRSLAREADVRGTIAQYVDANPRLEFVAADLMQDAGWDEAVRGCEYVVHTASPFPLHEPKDGNELIVPAVEGTLRVLRAANNAKCERVVLLSSNAAVSAGHRGENRTFNEDDWSLIENNIGPYQKSKTLAERAAWEFINGAANTNKIEMVSLNPPLVWGPIPSKALPTSAEIIRVFMKGEVPAVARIKMGLVDVRDVAAAILLAIITPAAAGHRLLLAADTIWYKEVVDILKREFPGKPYRIPTMVVPSLLARTMALFDKRVARVTSDVDWDYVLSSEKARRILNWKPRGKEEAILSMAHSLIEQGLV